eukprot:SAG31_NODE_5373_length_2578_cov_2.885693_1_plen_90_part_00
MIGRRAMVLRVLLALAIVDAGMDGADAGIHAGTSWSGPKTVPGVTGPGTASIIVGGEPIPAHWFTGGPFNRYTVRYICPGLQVGTPTSL